MQKIVLLQRAAAPYWQHNRPPILMFVIVHEPDFAKTRYAAQHYHNRQYYRWCLWWATMQKVWQLKGWAKQWYAYAGSKCYGRLQIVYGSYRLYSTASNTRSWKTYVARFRHWLFCLTPANIMNKVRFHSSSSSFLFPCFEFSFS